MNLETKLNESLNDILRSSGYIFEIINKNKKQSNLITGSNNQLIPPIVTAQLGNSISRFEDILDDTIAKFNDAKWCVEQILESKQKQEELKLKEEERKKEEEIRKKMEEQRKLKEEEDRKKEAERKRQQEEDRKRLEEQEKDRKKRKEQEDEEERKRQAEAAAAQEQANQDKALFDDFIATDFDFNMNDIIESGDGQQGNSNGDDNNNINSGLDIPNPTDILSSINYPDLMDGLENNMGGSDNKGSSDHNDSGNNNNDDKNKPDLDLDVNNILGNNDSILDGLNMSLLDPTDDINPPDGNTFEEDFDVDNFLNQFAGND
ncbi:hypothetical protein PSN45_001238 [Yamadazyma tenuis]|uniref:uncharacterized protein n=1 Tax=Candida tenuis TaxID=2315449 RepID=UPI0027A0B7A2|nr:hypothetical protein PSN45_001238 [Yamadazyma tenuis]